MPVDKETHTEKFVVVDRKGENRGYYHWNKPEEFAALQSKIDELLEEEMPVESEDEAAETNDKSTSETEDEPETAEPQD